VKIEADSNDITEHPHDDKRRPLNRRVCGKRFTTNDGFQSRKQEHAAEKFYSCSHCEKRFKALHSLELHMNVHSGKY